MVSATPDISLIAIDLDGTLLAPDKSLHPDFWPILAELTSRGIQVVPASGRQAQSIQGIFAAVASDLTFIAENGAFLGRGDEVLATDPVSSDAVATVLERVAAYAGDAGTVLCGVRSAYVERTDDAFLEPVSRYYPKLEIVPALAEVTDQILKVAVHDSAGSEFGVVPAIGEVPGARVLLSGKQWVDLMSPTADKGRALGLLQAELGLGPEHTMVFGDYPNDLGMIRAAHHSYAMADAHPEVAEAARYRAPSNSEAGVLSVLREVFQL